MIDKIYIKDFKSVKKIELELGRFNVFIGENGSGKSNILEAIAFGGAASGNLLFNEFYASRGIRVSNPQLIFSAFPDSPKRSKECTLGFEVSKNIFGYTLRYNTKRGWHEVISEKVADEVLKRYESAIKKNQQAKGNDGLKSLTNLLKVVPEKDRGNLIKALFEQSGMSYIDNRFYNQELSEFLIYSPEVSYLRFFSGEGQIEPLGIKGEGLFKQIKYLSEQKDKRKIKKIISHLKLLDWFQSFEVPEISFANERFISIKDKYLDETLNYFDQQMANEGFLFMLFYLTAFISDETPNFFAIDNLDTSFNPKLCTELTKSLVKLSKECKKQTIVTTHNPFILDGLDLTKDDQRLFVVRRDIMGHTIATRVPSPKESSVKLSEAWMNGYIGGLPNNF